MGYMQLVIASAVALPLPPQLALHPDDLAAVGIIIVYYFISTPSISGVFGAY